MAVTCNRTTTTVACPALPERATLLRHTSTYSSLHRSRTTPEITWEVLVDGARFGNPNRAKFARKRDAVARAPWLIAYRDRVTAARQARRAEAAS